MIIEIPSAQEFESVGLSLIDDAWDMAISFASEFEESKYFGADQEEDGDKYWQIAKKRLTRSLATLQNGVEFLVKAKIAAISPYLLISNSPKDYPKNSNKRDIFFADFRTIDAQDLLKVHDTFSGTRLPEEFAAEFERLRKQRNSIIHTVDKRMVARLEEVLVEVVSVFKMFYPDRDWKEERRRQLSISPAATLYSSDWVTSALISEFSLFYDLLSPKDLKNLYGINKTQRWYICPECHYETRDMELYPKCAQLKPNSSKSNTVLCYICDKLHDVGRKHCEETECKGNVISPEMEMCLTCGGVQR